MSDVNDEREMCAKLREFGGLGDMWGNTAWSNNGVELFDPFGVNSLEPFSKNGARECEAKLNTDAAKRAKIANDRHLMYLVYLKLVCAGIDRVEWTCVKREGFITQVRGTCCGASIVVVVYPEKYSFTITATMSSGSVKVYPVPVHTFNDLEKAVKTWRSAVARMTQ